MSVVTLVSGGLDSALMARITLEASIEQYPLFIDYGQRAMSQELIACRRLLKAMHLKPRVARLKGYGSLVCSGLTDDSKHIFEDAFTPGRNLLFLVIGASYAYRVGADGVAIGLLSEDTALFPDQTRSFLEHAEQLLTETLGKKIRVIAPLAEFTKRDVVSISVEKGLKGSYSCHKGTKRPCGKCIACLEYNF